MIKIENVSKNYISKSGVITRALNNVSLQFEEKGLVFVLGKSGSGKTTLLNIIGGLDKCDSGNVVLYGKSDENFNQDDYDSYRNTYVGFVFQEFNLLEDYNVFDNIALVFQLQRKKINKNKIYTVLDKLGLMNLKNRRVNELSGGQKQRVAIARALVKNPKIILADEPTGNLDNATGKSVMDILKEISKEILVLVVSHNEELAKTYADRIIIIDDGIVKKDITFKKYDSHLSNFKTIKSRLSIKSSFRLSMLGINNKKKNFIITSFLVSLTLLLLSIFVLTSTLSISTSHARILKDNEEYYIYLKKGNIDEELTFFDEEELKKLKNEFNFYNYNIVVSDENFRFLTYEDLNIKISNDDDENHLLYYNSSSRENLTLSIINSSTKYNNLIGRMPIDSNEIVITNYIADHIIKFGIYNENNEENVVFYSPSTYEDILNTNIKVRGKSIKIVGILDYDLSKYYFYKDKKLSELSELEQSIVDGINQTLEYKKSYLLNNIYIKEEFLNFIGLKNYSRIFLNINGKNRIVKCAEANDNLIYYDKTGIHNVDNLKYNEAIVSINWLLDNQYEQKLNDFVRNHESLTYENAKQLFIDELLENDTILDKEYEFFEEGEEEKSASKKIKIVGLYLDDSEENYVLFGENSKFLVYNKPYMFSNMTIYSNDEKELQSIFDNYSFIDASPDSIVAKSPYSFNLENAYTSLILIKNISSFCTLALLIFSILLIYNFINSTIHYNEKNIGILRSLGASKYDIFKIFILESLLLVLISLIFSIILLMPCIRIINDIFINNLHFDIKIIFFDWHKFIFLMLSAILLVVISSYFPINTFSRKKPIDVINKK